MNEKPLVSVIIPFYSNKEWLYEAVESVLNQTYKDYEIIVINDGSKEDISEFLSKYEDKIRYIRKNNGGPASARNLGIKESRGEFISFLDSDDLWTEGKLDYQINEMIRKNAAWSQTSYELFGDGVESKKIGVIGNPQLFKELLYVSNGIATPTVTINKNMFSEEEILFSESKRYGEDIDLWVRLSKKNDILSLDRVLTKVRIRGSNAALDVLAQLQNRAEVYETIKGKNEVSFGLELNYKLCNVIYNFIAKLKKQTSIRENIIGYLAKIGYVIPYIIFKIYKQIYIRKYK